MIKNPNTGEYFCLRRNGETPTPFLYSNLERAGYALKRRKFITRDTPITNSERSQFRIVPVQITELPV